MDHSNSHIIGLIKIWTQDRGEERKLVVDTRNAIHYENISEAQALSLANKGSGFIHEMVFGSGGTTVDSSGTITYLPTNTTGSNANLYNPTYYKVVDASSVLNSNPLKNYLEVRHVNGQYYTDIIVNAYLDYGEPAGQNAFDNSTDFNGSFVFDELGLRGWGGSIGAGKLLTHAIHSPVEKSLNRVIQIEYTVRIQSLSTNMTA